jgi:hypothetical protein
VGIAWYISNRTAQLGISPLRPVIATALCMGIIYVTIAPSSAFRAYVHVNVPSCRDAFRKTAPQFDVTTSELGAYCECMMSSFATVKCKKGLDLVFSDENLLQCDQQIVASMNSAETVPLFLETQDRYVSAHLSKHRDRWLAAVAAGSLNRPWRR